MAPSYDSHKRSAQTSQWDNISKRVKRYEKNIDTLDAQIAKAYEDVDEIETRLINEYEVNQGLRAKVIYYMELPASDRKFWMGTIRATQEQIREQERKIQHIRTNLEEFLQWIVKREELKKETLRRRDNTVTAYADSHVRDQEDIWPKDDDSRYETLYLPDGETKTRHRQPVYLPNGDLADYQDAYWRYPHPIGPLTNEPRAGQYFDNDGNLVLDLNPNPTNQVPYTVDWL